LPIINTLRQLLNSGDKIRRVDGIFSVSMSYIFYRISPPLAGVNESSIFDEEFCNGAFMGDVQPPSGVSMNKPCSFCQAVEEATALGLMEKDIEHDLANTYTTSVMMCLAKELGLVDSSLSRESIQAKSEVLAVPPFSDDVDDQIRKRVQAAADRGCVLRQVGSIDVATSSIHINVLEVPQNHIFANASPSCSVVRFFTDRYQPYPLVINGPAAGDACVSSALLAEVLSMMSSKIGPKSGKLARTGSRAFLS
jgi:homoserine dehydrogenase